MPCCKVEDYKWCKDLPVVEYKDEEGNEYCIFHAPQGKKGILVKEFNELIFQRINDAKENDKFCDLDGTIFEGDIHIWLTVDRVLPVISFNDAIFTGKTTFKGNIDPIVFNKEAYFTPTIFSEEADFSEVAFNKEAYFYGETFKKGGDFTLLDIKEKLRLEEVNLKKVTFIDTDLRKIDFINCIWPKKHNRFKRFEKWHEKYSRNILYDELNLFIPNDRDYTVEILNEKTFWGKLKYRFKYEWASFKKDISFDKDIKKVENLYRRLKQKYKEEHNEPEVSNWHYGEKEMYRKGSRFRRFFPLSFSNLYWLSSGYGERPLRAGIVLVLLIIFISVILGLTGIKSLDSNDIIKIQEWSDIWNIDYLKATIEYATFESKPDFIPLNWFLKIAAKLLIPLQTALFALAVRNRFRR